MSENKEKLEEVEEVEEVETSEEGESEMTPAQEKHFGKKEESLKDWYSNQLHDALLKKFKIKK